MEKFGSRMSIKKLFAFVMIFALTCIFGIFLVENRYDMQLFGYLPSFQSNSSWSQMLFLRPGEQATLFCNCDKSEDKQKVNILPNDTIITVNNENKMDTHNLYLLPDDNIIDAMDENRSIETYWNYINTIQVLCNRQLRLGSMKDGGKEICLDDLYRPKEPCLVYSFGSNFQFDFELAVMQNFRCEIHTFDPSHPINRKVPIPTGVSFHLIGLANTNMINPKRWQMQTLSTIWTSLTPNRVIDILKIDIEGGEWSALTEIFQSGVLKYVKQLSIEIHYGRLDYRRNDMRTWGDVSTKHQLKVLRQIHEEGFHIFMHERNMYSLLNFTQTYPTIATVNEISLINVRWKDNV